MEKVNVKGQLVKADNPSEARVGAKKIADNRPRCQYRRHSLKTNNLRCNLEDGSCFYYPTQDVTLITRSFREYTDRPLSSLPGCLVLENFTLNSLGRNQSCLTNVLYFLLGSRDTRIKLGPNKWHLQPMPEITTQAPTNQNKTHMFLTQPMFMPFFVLPLPPPRYSRICP